MNANQPTVATTIGKPIDNHCGCRKIGGCLNGVLVVAELGNGAFKRETFHLASMGRTLADAMGGELTVAVLGTAPKCEDLARYGADRIDLVKDESLNDFLIDVHAQVLARDHQTGKTLPGAFRGKLLRQGVGRGPGGEIQRLGGFGMHHNPAS